MQVQERRKPKIFLELDDEGNIIRAHNITAAARYVGYSHTLLLNIAKGRAGQIPKATVDKVLAEYPELKPKAEAGSCHG